MSHEALVIVSPDASLNTGEELPRWGCSDGEAEHMVTGCPVRFTAAGVDRAGENSEAATFLVASKVMVVPA